MSRIFNFSAGPAMLPEPVLRQAQSELLDWKGTGMSVMEISHRSSSFDKLAQASESTLRDLLNIPAHYHVLFMHGGGQGQFSAVPLNLIGDYSSAAYVDTGVWGSIAIKEAKRFCCVEVVASGEDTQYTTLPEPNTWKHCEEAAYLHYVVNETVNGLEFKEPPSVPPEVPLVADMSSNILSRPIEIEKYGVIYACAQKNLGPAGITVVIIREDLLDRNPIRFIPSIFDYRLAVKQKSMLNTPATFSWYMLSLVLEWVKSEGGVEVMDRKAKQRSQLLYDYIDQTEFYYNPVDPKARSRMNVVFFLRETRLEEVFLKRSLEAGLSGLKGHRVLGGLRASLYNAMPYEGVEALITFMKDFEKQYG